MQLGIRVQRALGILMPKAYRNPILQFKTDRVSALMEDRAKIEIETTAVL